MKFLILSTLSLLVGCIPAIPGTPCTKDSDCTAISGAFCDQTSGYCARNPGADGGSGWVLTLGSPSNGARVNGTASATVQLTFSGAAAPTPPTSLTLSATPPTGSAVTSTLTKGGTSTYSGALPSGLVNDQTYTLQAQFPGGAGDGGTALSNTVSVTFDNVPPAFTVNVPPPPTRMPHANLTVIDPDVAFDGGQAYRRDETVTVTVTSSSADVDAGSVQLTVTGIGSGATAAPIALTSCAGPGYCGQATVDLAQPIMMAFNGDFTFRANGADTAGNASSTPATAVAGVTRWRWSYDAGGPTFGIKASPAVGHNGSIYFGTTAGGSGSLYALNPDGTQKWSAPTSVGSITASPSVGRWDAGDETLFVGATTASGVSLLAVSGFDGGIVVSNIAGATGDTVDTSSAVTMTTVSSKTIESGIFVVNYASSPTLVAFRPLGGLNQTKTFSLSNSVAGVVVTDGTSAYFGDSTGLLQGISIATGNWVAKLSPWPISFGTLGANGLSMDSSATNVFGTTGSGSAGSLFKIAASSAGTLTPFSTSPKPPSGIALSTDGKVFFTDSTPKLTQTPTSLPATVDQSVSTSGPVKTAPVLASGQRIYTVSATGALESWALPLGTSHEWSLSGLGAVNSSPNLDCNRDQNGSKLAGRPGILYFGNDSGSLYSIIVDSPSIDTSAPWPRYQHDPRNTGNTNTPLTEFQCQ